MNDSTPHSTSSKTRQWLIAFAIGLAVALIAVLIFAMLDHSAIAVFYVGLGVCVVLTPLIYWMGTSRTRR